MLLIQCNFYTHHFPVQHLEHTLQKSSEASEIHKNQGEFSGIRAKIQDAEVQPDTFCWKKWQESQFGIQADQHLSSLFVSSLGMGKELPINLPENKLKF